jgi:hypothetical protein
VGTLLAQESQVYGDQACKVDRSDPGQGAAE